MNISDCIVTNVTDTFDFGVNSRREEGFANGLVNSRIFIPILSKNAINHPTIDRQNFGSLTSTSTCGM